MKFKEGSVWEKWGKENPYFSVISDPLFDIKNFDESAMKHFYGGGETDVELIFSRIPTEFRVNFNTALDFGCGVGRLSQALAKRFNSVVACDISQSHLDLAKKNLDSAGTKNVQFRNLNSSPLEDLNGQVDFLCTILVLQHLPSDELKPTLDQLMKTLRSGGVAAFQVPTFHEKYSFEEGTYMKGSEIDPNFLINGLSHQLVHKLARSNSLKFISSHNMDCVGSGWDSCIFYFTKADARI